MTPTNEVLFNTLKKIRLDLASMEALDLECVARVGAEIEHLSVEHEADLQDTSDVLSLCLALLQEVYVNEDADFPGIASSVQAGLVAVEHCIASSHSAVSSAMAAQAAALLREIGKSDEALSRSGSDEFGNALDHAIGSISELSVGDNTAIVQAGAAIEKLVTDFESQLAHRVDGLSLCLSALQHVYVNPDQQATEVFTAISEIVQSLRDDSAVETVDSQSNILNGLLEADQEAEADSTELAAEPAPLRSLDDVASLMMQIGPDETNEIAAIAEALKQIAEDTKDAKHRKLLVKSARSFAKLVKGKASNFDEVSKELSDTIELISKDGLAEMVAPSTQATKPAETPKPPSAPSMEQDDGLLAEFIVESGELIEAAEQSLLALENDPEDIESINTVFRAFHSVKGTSAFLGLKDMTDFAHLAESLLSRMRDREIRCTGGYADLALRSVDVIKAMLKALGDAMPGRPDSLPNGYAELFEVLKDPEASGVGAEGSNSPTTSALSAKVETAETVETTKPGGNAESSVRVRTDRLDSLIDMIGELVIAQSMLSQDSTVLKGIHPDLSRKISHAGKIVRELQDLSMSMRMVPLKNTFQKMARIVRDVAKKCGKAVEFVTTGDDTEVDRNMVDIIADPLVHMVRNAVDHGIESPQKRTAAGKPVGGRVTLSAYHAGGDVVVELSDDGAGLDRDRIVAKAIANGLIESDAGMSDGEVFRLIFAPGFSTADEVTDVSGRGVGMDVVRRNIEGMRGRVQITSKKGEGSVFTIRLPLTLAITDGMLVRVGDERFIVPTINIQLSFQPNRDMLSTIAGRGELVNLRGEFLRVFRLHRLFDIKGAIENPTDALLMIVADGRRRCALLVDELLGQHQVVTKSLGEGIGKIHGVSGGAILGDGCVGLILDAAELVSMSRENANSHNRKGEHVRHAA